MTWSARFLLKVAIAAIALGGLLGSADTLSGNPESEATKPGTSEAIRVTTAIASDGVVIASPVVELIPGVVGELTISRTDG